MRSISPEEKLQSAKFKLLQLLNDIKKAALRAKFTDEEKQSILDEINDAWSRIVTCKPNDLFHAAHQLYLLRRHMEGDFVFPANIGRRQPIKDLLAAVVVFALLIYAKQEWRSDTGRTLGVDDVAIRRRGRSCWLRWTVRARGSTVVWELPVKKGKCEEAARLVHKIRQEISRCEYPDSYDALQLSILLEWLHWVVDR